MSTTGKEHGFLELEGPISVTPVTPEQLQGKHLQVVLLMGPTGSGKSAFIESLSPDQNLEISKDSLESMTQEVICYRVVNVTRYIRTIILVDTPGFLDTKLSESWITAKITDTLGRLCQSAKSVIVGIFYFQPITDIRLGGSKREAVKLLRAFAESFGAGWINVITTMWNHMASKQIEDAHNRFRSLEDEIYVTSDRLYIEIVKFEFSFDSAMSILDSPYGWEHDINKSQNMNPQYQTLTLNNLVHRIANIQLQLRILAEDKQNATTPGRKDPLLLEVILRDETAALCALQSFLDDLVEIGPAGLTSLESLLDVCYDTNPSSSSSPCPQAVVPSSTASLVRIHSLPDTSPAIQSQGPSSSHIAYDIPGAFSIDPTSCELRLPLSPSPSPSHNSLKSRVKGAVAPLKGVFRKLKK